jgi:methylamine dehydrogenase accessory protein MauD
MSGLWLVSYLALWALVLGMAVLLYGALRQIGVLHLQLQRSAQADVPPTAEAEADAEIIPPLEEDGPALGTPIPAWVFEQGGISAEGGPATVRTKTLLMFMSPMCETCQHVVEPLNALAADTERRVRPLAVFRSDRPAYEAFLKVFPMRMPTLHDHDRTLTMEVGVHRTPFGLLYDEEGILIRKGLVEGEEDMAAVLGDESAPEAAQLHVYPRASSVELPA